MKTSPIIRFKAGSSTNQAPCQPRVVNPEKIGDFAHFETNLNLSLTSLLLAPKTNDEMLKRMKFLTPVPFLTSCTWWE
jgi:hypothetical protein